jgi:drug/metabolite transporter (DMT)-like permease
MTQDRPLLGITFMIGFCIFAPMGDAIAKLLGDTIPLMQLLLVRFIAQMVLLWPIIWITKLPVKLPRRLFWFMVLRTLLHMCGIGAMFTALRYLPLADAVAIAFVMPFIILLLGKYFFAEDVGAHRLGACVVGFIGTLLVIQPSFADVGLPALLPVLVAVVFALFMLVTRRLAKEVDAMNLQAQSGVIATVLLGIAYFTFRGTEIEALQIIAPTQTEWVWLIAIGIFGTMGHLLMTWSLRFAQASTLAPMQYLEIPIATVIGFIMFRDFPNGLAALGIAITIGAGLYIILREQHLSRQTS